MAVSISTAARNHVLESLFNGQAGINFNSGILRIYDGAAPDVNAAATGTVLVEITLPADAFDVSASGSVSKLGTWEDSSANASGTASHFRILQSGDADGATGATDERLQGTVTATGGGGDMELDSITISLGQTVTVTSFSVTMPAGG